jgi:hypothetical protein
MNKFSVTYDIITPESAEQGDYAESGYVLDNVSLRDALHEFTTGCCEANCHPFSVTSPPRWFTYYDGATDDETGATENRSLHLPHNITPSSALRIARLVEAR